MKAIVSITLAAFLGSAGGAGGGGSETARLTSEERQELLNLLSESKSGFLQLVEGTSPDQWSFKPAPNRWSVGQVAEHILRTEKRLYETAQRALRSEPDGDWQSKTAGKAELLKRVMPDRRSQAQAPQEVRPEGELSREEILNQYRTHRQTVEAFAAGTQLALKEHVSEHPFPVFSFLNAHDWLLYVPLHTIRHTKQIAEVQADPGYPD